MRVAFWLMYTLSTLAHAEIACLGRLLKRTLFDSLPQLLEQTQFWLLIRRRNYRLSRNSSPWKSKQAWRLLASKCPAGNKCCGRIDRLTHAWKSLIRQGVCALLASAFSFRKLDVKLVSAWNMYLVGALESRLLCLHGLFWFAWRAGRRIRIRKAIKLESNN